MRHSKSCPKCASADILCLPAKSGEGAVALGNWWPTFVWPTRYVCGACGYTEQWIESADDVRKIRDKCGTEAAR